MKRMLTKITAFALICTMLTGCSTGKKSSRDDDDDDSDRTEASEETEDTEETDEPTIHTEKSEETTEPTDFTTEGTTGMSDLTLEEALNQPLYKDEFDRQIASLLENETYAKMYSDIRWIAEGNTLTYEYYYAQDYTDDQLAQIKSSIESQSETLLSAISSAKDGFETSLGVRPEEIAYVYYTNSGEEIVRVAG